MLISYPTINTLRLCYNQYTQCTYSNEAGSFNHCCSGKAISVTYSECVSVALVIQHAMRMRHIVICGLHGSTIFTLRLCYNQHTQCTYSNEAGSFNHCCSGKAISVTYSECVSVALVIQHAMRMRHIVICGLHGSSTIFFHIISRRHDFLLKKLNTKLCFDFLYNFCLKRFSF